MSALLFCLALAATQDVSAPGSAPQAGSAAQQSAPVPALLPAEESSAPSAPPYEGSFSEGMRELRQHARAGEYEEALALADGLLAAEVGGSWRTSVESRTGGWSEALLSHLEGPLEWLGVSMRTSADRAEVHYARGVVLHELARPEESRESFGKARMLAGPGPTRLDAVYDLGTSALFEGEAWRAKIPEISGAQNPPIPGAPSAGPGAGPGQPLPGAQAPAEEDPLARAKAAYLDAREHLLERLRSDWQDADSRANVELALRRLRELEAIERQRKEEEQQKPQDQKQDPKQKQDQDPKPGDKEKQDQPEDEKSEQQQDKPQEPKPDESKPEEPPKDESKDEAAQPEEKELTKEEVQRLLDRLAEHEKEGEEVHQRLQRLRRVPVKRDW